MSKIDITTETKTAAAGGRKEPSSHATTDLGNAERLAARAAGRLLWVRELGWLCWDGRRWERAVSGEEVREATAMVRAIYGEAARFSAAAAGDTDEERRKRLAGKAKALGKWAVRSEAAASVRAALELARSREALVARPEALDADPNALNVANGILDLATLELRDHDPEARHTKVTRAAYDPGAGSEDWQRFLTAVLPSEEVRRYVQKAIGYSLLGRYSEHLFIPGAAARTASPRSCAPSATRSGTTRWRPRRSS